MRKPTAVAGASSGLGALLAAGLLFGALRDTPRGAPARTEAAAPAPAVAGTPARPPASGLCFHGPGGELAGLAPAGRRCP